jgi:type IV secretion system protein VirD4
VNARRHRPLLGQRTLQHVSLGRQIALARGHSLLVVGPTQVGKTSGIVVPAILRWSGPLVVTSVKRDVVELTSQWRAAQGPIVNIEPGHRDGATWDPLEFLRDYHDALGVARDLVVGERARASAESEFWNALAVKVFAGLALRTKQRGEDVFDLLADVERREGFDDLQPTSDSDANRTLRSLASHEPRTTDAVMTTVEAMLTPWQRRQPLAQLAGVLDAGTVYLVAPRHDQRRYEGVFRGVLASLVSEQHRRVDAGTAAEVLFVLDEAAAVAPLEDLDQLAATGRGLGITLLSVFQDFAQIEGRWGERAATIVNNHSTRLVLGGLLDPRVTTYLPELAPSDERSAPLRMWPTGSAALISGRRALLRTRLRPWWKSRSLRRRVNV